MHGADNGVDTYTEKPGDTRPGNLAFSEPPEPLNP